MFPDRGHLPSQGCVAWLDENRGDKEPSLCSSYIRSEAHPLPGPHPVLRRALSHGQKADCRLPDKSDDSMQATLPSRSDRDANRGPQTEPRCHPDS